MKFVLFVEGFTEQKAIPAFLKRWLDAQLTKPVGIKTVRFDGWPELVKDSPTKAKLYLNDPKGKDDTIAVIALLDLYGPTFYPADKTHAVERCAWAKEYLEKQVGQEKFRQYFAVHETEAWLLSDPGIFPTEVQKALPKKLPEAVNFDKPPAKLLNEIYDSKFKRDYKKVTNGQELFAKLNPAAAYEKCPHLRAMLDDMLELAQQAGL